VSGQRPTLSAVAKRRSPALAEIAYLQLREAGYGRVEATKRAADVLTTAACLAIAFESGAGVDGAWPTQREYAAYWKRTDRSAQREWAEFRKAFPGSDGPDALAKELHALYRHQLRDVGPGVVLSAPGDLALAAA
jgi:hypothetical protein